MKRTFLKIKPRPGKWLCERASFYRIDSVLVPSVGATVPTSILSTNSLFFFGPHDIKCKFHDI